MAGLSEEGKSCWERKRGYSSDCSKIYGSPLQKPEQAETLNERLSIIARLMYSKSQSDEETFDG